ncbi:MULTISPECIES: dTDP-4-dehydrorhamnose reductase [Desulfosediminicola]|uniref:dTDP-4-dehydrorhamnose reductase n=1 Tax=Desulfosediminicola TaxID=2886823 RepID=UPI0010AC7EF7|nr:dTDP-4-dehydrorhamnose reductase [Desulfosediminicola ganghwensis]
MKIVITGSTGQLGRDCCALLAENHQVIGCNAPRMDISDAATINSHIARHQPEVLINCAAYTAVDACETEREHAWKVNALGPELLAKASHEHNFRLIHISTDYVFDGSLPAPEAYTENDSTNPLSEYGRSKLAGEEAIARYAEDYVILRTAWLYSAHGKNFLKTMLRLALADKAGKLANGVRVVHDQYGSLTWSYTLAQQIERLLTSDIKGIVHATADGYSTWFEAALYFLMKMGIEHNFSPCATSDYPTPAHRPANSILANSRLDGAGISTFRHWQKDIDRFVNHHREELLKEAETSLGI